MCSTLLPHLNAYVSHLRLVHGSDGEFFVECNISDCHQEFRAFAAFNSHIYRHHRDELGLEIQRIATGTAPEYLLTAEQQNSHDSDEPFSEDLQHDISLLLGTDGLQQRRESAKFLLKLSEVHCVSQKTIMGANNDLFSRTIGRAKAVVVEKLMW